MQWIFVVAGLLAALAEMHTGTIFLAGVAVAAFASAGLGYWITGTALVEIFAALCVAITVAIALVRGKRARGGDTIDFDIGQTVSVSRIGEPGHHLIVTYRGVEWSAAMDDGSAPQPGDNAVIARKTDKLLHLVASP